MIKIKKAEKQKLRELIELRLSLLKHYPDAFLPTYKEEKRCTSKEWQDNFFVDNQTFVVEEKNQLVGMVYVNQFKNQRARHVARISGLGVLPDFRRQGAGKSIIEAVINWAKKENIHRLQVEAFADNQGAIAFYQKMGFKKESIIKDSALNKNGTYQDSLEMVIFFLKGGEQNDRLC